MRLLPSVRCTAAKKFGAFEKPPEHLLDGGFLQKISPGSNRELLPDKIVIKQMKDFLTQLLDIAFGNYKPIAARMKICNLRRLIAVHRDNRQAVEQSLV